MKKHLWLCLFTAYVNFDSIGETKIGNVKLNQFSPQGVIKGSALIGASTYLGYNFSTGCAGFYRLSEWEFEHHPYLFTFCVATILLSARIGLGIAKKFTAEGKFNSAINCVKDESWIKFITENPDSDSLHKAITVKKSHLKHPEVYTHQYLVGRLNSIRTAIWKLEEAAEKNSKFSKQAIENIVILKERESLFEGAIELITTHPKWAERYQTYLMVMAAESAARAANDARWAAIHSSMHYYKAN